MKPKPRQTIPTLIVCLLLLVVPDIRASYGGSVSRTPSPNLSVYPPEQTVTLNAERDASDGGRGYPGSYCSYTGSSTSTGSTSPLTLWLGIDGSWTSNSMPGTVFQRYDNYTCTDPSSGVPSSTSVWRSSEYSWSYTMPSLPAGTVVEYNVDGISYGVPSGYAVGWKVSHSPVNGELSPHDDLWINVDTARSASFGFTAVEVEYSVDGTNWESASLTNQPQYDHDQWSVNLGTFEAGATVQYTVSGTDLSGNVQTLVQSGNEYHAATVAVPLQWIGNSRHWPANGELDSEDDLWINCETWPAGKASKVEVVYSTDGGSTWLVAALSQDSPSGSNDRWSANVGTFAPGTTIQYALVADDIYGTKLWDNNDGPNYLATVNFGTPLSGMGNTTQSPPDGQLAAGEELWIRTETWPAGAALEANVAYSADGGATWQVAAMSLTGQSGGNDVWEVNLGTFPEGAVVSYAIWVVDGLNQETWDNNGGGNYVTEVPLISHSPDNESLSRHDDLVITFDATGSLRGYTLVEVVFSLDGGATWLDAPMVLTAMADSDHWEVNLGKFLDGTVIEYALVGTDAEGDQQWLSNGGENYEAIVGGKFDSMVAPLSGPSPDVTVTSTFYGLEGWLAFDGNPMTAWKTAYSADGYSEVWIGYDFGEPTRIDRYTITSRQGKSTGASPPRDFELQGSNGGEWVTLDTRSGESSWNYPETRSYFVADPGDYERYRLLVTEDNYPGVGVTTLFIHELGLERKPEFLIGHIPEDGDLTSEDDLMITFDGAGSHVGYSLVEVVYSVDRGATWLAAPLALTAETGYDHWEVNLGAFVGGTTIRYALVATDAAGEQEWFSNGGVDYSAVVEPPAIAHFPDNGSLTSTDDLVVSFDAKGAERGYELVEAVYSIDDGVTWLAAPLVLTVEADHDHWEANLGQFVCGSEIDYVLVGTNGEGAQDWFNNGRVDFHAVVAAPDYVNLVTPLTGPSPKVTVSGVYRSYSTYDGWHAFDGSVATPWRAEYYTAPAWIAYEFEEPTRVDRYSLTLQSPTAYKPITRFEFQGWNGSEWVTLDTRTVDSTIWIGSTPHAFLLSNPGIYAKYRLFVIEDSHPDVAIAEPYISEMTLEQASCPE